MLTQCGTDFTCVTGMVPPLIWYNVILNVDEEGVQNDTVFYAP